MLCFPGRFLGTEPCPRIYEYATLCIDFPNVAFSKEHLWQYTEQAAVRRQLRRGKVPTFCYVWIFFWWVFTYALQKMPLKTTHSWVRMWDDHLHWKRWVLERKTPIYSST